MCEMLEPTFARGNRWCVRGTERRQQVIPYVFVSLDTVQRDDGLDIVLVHHPPEVDHRGRERGLGHDVPLLPLVVLS